MAKSDVHKLSAGKIAEDAFVSADSISKSDIETIAQDIVDRFFAAKAADPSRNRVIIDVLNAELALTGWHKDTWDPDIFAGIVNIRKAVVETLERNPKFQSFRDVADWDVITDNILQAYGARTSIEVLKSGAILKKILLKGNETDQMHSSALEKLYSLPERSPNLAYPIKETVKVVEGDQYEIQEYLNMTNLEELQGLSPEKRPPLSKLLKYVLDCVNGLQFLIQNDFVLSDFRPSNLGVNKDTDTGILFDLDSLYQKGDSALYQAHPRFLPREFVAYNQPRVFQEGFMVLEFGITISELIGDQMPELKTFVDRMKAYPPENRPSLDEVAEMLERSIR